MLKHYVLSSSIPSRHRRINRSTTLVTRCVKHKGEIGIVCVAFDFFNDGHPSAGLLVQDDWFKTKIRNESSDFLLCFIVSAMDDEYFSFIAGHDSGLASAWRIWRFAFGNGSEL
ncbi:hypothetical protein MCEMSHM24_02488 [Comamonadaceae bacterium]